MFTSVGLTLLCLALVPVYLLSIAFFGIFSFFGIATGILPLVHHGLLRRERKRLASLLVPNEGAVIELVAAVEEGDDEKPRRLAVRWSPGTNPQLPPVVLANGLGATMLTIAGLHDLLEAEGFPVLSYDRAGVAMSDPWPSGAKTDDVEGTMADMRGLMERFHPSSNKPWVVVGLSMGSVVAQCFVARHSEMVSGFVNVDGLPFPFSGKRDKFMAAAKAYCLAACASQIGLLRPPLALFGGHSTMLRQAATPPRFPFPVLLAQMQDPKFFSAIADEMSLMLALCDAAAAAWGPAFDLAHLNAGELEALANAAPSACGDVSDAAQGPGSWTELSRAPVERGEDWTPVAESKAVLARLLARAAHYHQQEGQAEGGAVAAVVDDVEQGKAPAPAAVPITPLWLVWQRLSVRVLSARSYDFALASSWYSPEMQTLAAAEHALHALLPGGGDGAGKRLVFPRRSHAKMFFGIQGLVVQQVKEIAAAVAGQQEA